MEVTRTVLQQTHAGLPDEHLMDKDGEDVLRGICDLCGEPSDGSVQECNYLSCTFAGCKEILYHQASLGAWHGCRQGAHAAMREAHAADPLCAGLPRQIPAIEQAGQEQKDWFQVSQRLRQRKQLSSTLSRAGRWACSVVGASAQPDPCSACPRPLHAIARRSTSRIQSSLEMRQRNTR